MRHFLSIFEHCCKWCKWLGLTTKTWSHLNVNHWTCPFWCSPRALFDKVLFMPIKTSTNQIHFHIQNQDKMSAIYLSFFVIEKSRLSQGFLCHHRSQCLKITEKVSFNIANWTKMVNLRSNSVTRHDAFNRTKIGENGQNWKCDRFGWFSNTVLMCNLSQMQFPK